LQPLKCHLTLPVRSTGFLTDAKAGSFSFNFLTAGFGKFKELSPASLFTGIRQIEIPTPPPQFIIRTLLLHRGISVQDLAMRLSFS
jgi:hypothetical protein